MLICNAYMYYVAAAHTRINTYIHTYIQLFSMGGWVGGG